MGVLVGADVKSDNVCQDCVVHEARGVGSGFKFLSSALCSSGLSLSAQIRRGVGEKAFGCAVVHKVIFQ